MSNEDMSDIFEKLSGSIDKDKINPDMVSNLLNMLQNSDTTSKNSQNGSTNAFNSTRKYKPKRRL